MNTNMVEATPTLTEKLYGYAGRKIEVDGQYHDVEVIYEADSQEVTIAQGTEAIVLTVMEARYLREAIARALPRREYE